MIVLVTGCRSGFGLLIAVTAARAGHTVYAGLRDPLTADELRAASAGLDITPIALDIADPAQRVEAVRRILSERGRIDALINNAGITLGGFLETVDEDEFRRVMEVNLFATWALIQQVLPSMRAQRGGVVINVSSVAGLIAMPGLGVYAASKFALEGMSEAMRHELAPFGVRICLVEPGPYATDILHRNRAVGRRAMDPKSEYFPYVQRAEELFNRVVESGTGDPQVVADTVVQLLNRRTPPLRTSVGTSARVRIFMKRYLPFALIEALIARLTRPRIAEKAP